MDLLTPAASQRTEPLAHADPGETQEWLDALSGTITQTGKERGTY